MKQCHLSTKHTQLPSRSPASIAVIGGGTAGWMTAATLRRRLGCVVTLVESATVPTIGVGEATIPSLIDWLENMQLDEAEFMRQTGATFKLGIRFDNWISTQHRYWHPFGICGASINGTDLVHYWQRGKLQGWLPPESEYSDFSLQRELCELGRVAVDANAPYSVVNYAYHLDAARLAAFLRKLAESEGVQRIEGDVTGVRQQANGEIAAVRLSNHADLAADLFIDCTGFSAVLMERHWQVPWRDHSHELLCDHAVVARSPHVNQNVAPYTISTGLQAGWAWRIPLRETIGNGYVYSSSHISHEQARHELLQHAGLSADTPTRLLRMRIGRRQSAWHRNCVAIGLSAGFIEPLESTGIFLIQRALDDLVDCLPNEHAPADPVQFNRRYQLTFEEIRDFVLLHYVLSQRDDTAFWRDARGVTLPESLSRFMNDYEQTGSAQLDNPQPVFAPANHHFLMTAGGRMPASSRHRSATHPTWQVDSQQLAAIMGRLQWQQHHMATHSPTHRQALDSIYYRQELMNHQLTRSG